MNTQQGPNTNKGDARIPSKNYLAIVTNTAWTLATVALWPLVKISPAEVQHIKACIKQYILLGTDYYRGYMHFCERILLAKEILFKRNKCRYVLYPAHWIQSSEANSFKDTEQLHIFFLLTRKQTRLYKLGLSALAEGVLHLSEELTLTNFLYWVKFFKSIHAEKELSIFHTCVDKLTSEVPSFSNTQPESDD